ncbi:capsular exopolysaccharide family [Flaviramulus basaltis]|uniref:non-specific protein-tyrosine kinase n=1 Tax=Flaviramulus basaltis TaxID=369401 RepID=A0A1K2INY7_9FLAO|nr:tyrosine-protein kinase family protein [Flaviramulus basaltis]SFZ94014.1 capsular exopolysaccharide family [Flaviramulus basaltis]
MEKDIIKILTNYLRYWYLFLICATICVALAFLYLRYKVTPVYYVSGKILLNDKENGGGDASGLESLNNLGLIKMSRNIQDEIGVLRSYDLMETTIEELGLSVGYFIEGRFNEVEIYEKSIPFKVVINDSVPILQYGTLGSILVIDEFSYELQTIDSDENIKKETYNFGEELVTDFGQFHLVLNEGMYDLKSQSPVIVRFRNVKAIASNYNNGLQVYPVYENGGGLLQLGLTDAIPQRGVDLINKLINVYARKSAEHKNTLAKSTLKLIDERLELLTTDLDIAEKGVENYKQRNDLTNVSSDAARFIQMADEADRELVTLRTEINALNSLESSLSQSSAGSFSPISSFNIQNSILTSSIISYNEIIQKRRNLVSASGTGNPMLPEIDRQLSDAKNIILGNVRSIKLELTRSQRDIINKSAQYRSKISTVPTAERALLEINRDQGLKQNLYLFLLQKREEEALSISVPFSDTRIIEAPRSGSFPTNGGKMPVYLGALLFGMFIPFVWVFAKDKLNTKILDKGDIEEITDNPILGTIASNKGKEVVVVSENNITPVAELFRLMRHNLKFLSQGKSNQVVMVTSAKQGEGKTFVSINLGASLAITGKKVVVLGFDLRVPKLMKDLGLTYDYGLSDFIVDTKIKVDDIIMPYNKVNNLFFIGSGAIPPNPGELLLSERVEELIKELKKVYDYIIIDTPPIGKVADAYSLSRFVDSTLFVVRYDYTKKEELNIINEISKSNKLNPLMIVLNDAKMDKSGIYSYGYGPKKA